MDEETRRPRVTIDLTYVIFHATWHPTLDGIARVQLDVAIALLRLNPAAIPFSLDNGAWRDLRPLIESACFDSQDIFAALHEHFFFRRESPRWRDPRHLFRLAKAHVRAFFKRLRARAPEIGADDTLFVGGAFWMNRNVLNFIGHAAKKGAHLVVLFHDLIPFTHPQFTGHDFTDEYREVLCLPAHFIVTTPFNLTELESVRARFCPKAQPLSASIVALADEFLGAARNERSPPPSGRLARLAGRDFALCVGTIEVRKNHITLVSCWEEFAAEPGDRLPLLVIAGRRGWRAEEVLRRLDELEQKESPIVFVEAPTEGELRWLYSACLFTVLPSWFEGWGLPVGEGYWFGKTCAASNTSSIPTVGRDACEYFSPTDKDEMKAAIRRLLDPAVRASYEAKIKAMPLRTWAQVGSDIARVIVDCSKPQPKTR